MAGYWGKSMSNNAVEAYERGEKPISKWSKRALLAALDELIEQGTPAKVNLDDLKKFKLPQLKFLFLEYAGWHHTYVRFYRTAFFRIKKTRLNCTVDELCGLLKAEDITK